MEYALLELEVEIVVACDLENVRYGRYVGRLCFLGGPARFRGYSYVVHINTNECAIGFMFGNRLAIAVVHKGLECGGRVAEPKHHYTRLVKATARFERCLMSIGLFDADVVVSLSYVELGVQPRASQVANEITNEWEGVLVTDCVFVNGSVVLHGAQLPVFLFDKEKQRGVWGYGGFDVPLRELFVNPGIECLVLFLRHRVDLAGNRVWRVWS